MSKKQRRSSRARMQNRQSYFQSGGVSVQGARPKDWLDELLHLRRRSTPRTPEKAGRASFLRKLVKRLTGK